MFGFGSKEIQEALPVLRRIVDATIPNKPVADDTRVERRFNRSLACVLTPLMKSKPELAESLMAITQDISTQDSHFYFNLTLAAASILIAISKNNEVWIDKRRIDVRAVRANVERLLAENPQGSVVIQADKASTTETLIKVMDAARSAGVFNVAIAAQEP